MLYCFEHIFFYTFIFSVEQKREIEFYEKHEKETGGKKVFLHTIVINIYCQYLVLAIIHC